MNDGTSLQSKQLQCNFPYFFHLDFQKMIRKHIYLDHFIVKFELKRLIFIKKSFFAYISSSWLRRHLVSYTDTRRFHFKCKQGRTQIDTKDFWWNGIINSNILYQYIYIYIYILFVFDFLKMFVKTLKK